MNIEQSNEKHLEFLQAGPDKLRNMPGFKIAWHYTAWTNWLSIRRDGLRCYRIDKPEIQSWQPEEEIDGIWIWPKRLHGIAHCGSIYFQAATKASSVIALLKVKYRPRDLLYKTGDVLLLKHMGHIGTLKYHDLEPALMLFKDIPASQISLAGRYDLTKQFRSS